MSFRFRCPNGHVLKAVPSMSGKRMRCPKCRAAVEVPAEGEAVDPPAPGTAAEAESPAAATRPESPRPVSRPAPPKPSRPPAAPRGEKAAPSAGASGGKAPPPLPRGARGSESGGGAAPPPVVPPRPAPPAPARKPPAKSGRWRDEHPHDPPSPDSVPRQDSPPGKAVPPPRPASAASAKAGPSSAPPAPPPRPVAPARVDESEPAPPPAADSPPPERRLGYRAELPRRVTVYWLALALAAVTLIGFLPARGFYALGEAPLWAQVLWVMTALQAAYVVYLVSIPDWSTTWVAMLVFAGVSAVYGFVLALAIWTAGSDDLGFGLEPYRGYVLRWSAGMLLLSFMAAFTAGRISFTWHRRYRYLAPQG